ncbi:5'-methylthioadenosine/S-adenosylhomocysteine nucleosidase family protein [Ulvibacter antarcticus]|uniref:Nucleoside phosphorylase n=1 Tax=Ulvibacter antarcticus TaxID=442714 RepID=A0A3L9Z484_9FLAO|nr:hypothetical protein [Ulvibacter antarcticus]RMA67683.1 nucleoside phosphorylase [Ulvibacter antarcticus]
MIEITQILVNASKFGKEAREILGSPKIVSSPELYFDIGIITATDEEFNSFVVLLEECEEFNTDLNDSTIYYEGKISTNNGVKKIILPYPISMGVEAVVSTTSKLLTQFNLKYLFMVGICAGNKNVTNIGDVIIAEKSLNYNEIVEVQKEDKDVKKKFRQNADSIDKNLKSRLSLFTKQIDLPKIKGKYKDNSDFTKPLKCHIGLMVSGSSLLRSDSKIKEINEDYHGIKGMDMETNGFYFTSSHSLKDSKPKFVSIKSVSDFGDSTNHKLSGEKRKSYALHTSSTTLLEFIFNHVK